MKSLRKGLMQLSIGLPKELRHKNGGGGRRRKKGTGSRYCMVYYNPDGNKERAMCQLRNAIDSGYIVRLPCVVCGSTRLVEAHHEDYTKPLDVVWLCLRHHRAVHNSLLHLKAI